MKRITMMFLLLIGGWLMAQANPDRSPNDKNKEQVTARGCVGRSSGDHVLTQLDPGNSYVLHAVNNIKLGHYLGQEVKVTGTNSPTLNDASDAGRSAPSTTITVNSVATISEECRL
jgi:hypothetical protein